MYRRLIVRTRNGGAIVGSLNMGLVAGPLYYLTPEKFKKAKRHPKNQELIYI